MWEFDDTVEVHSVSVDGVQTPDQFLWRGRLWRVCTVKSHRTETAAWWERGIIGTGQTHDPHTDPVYDAYADLAYDARTDLAQDTGADRRAAADGSLARIDAAVVAEVCSAARRPARTHKAGVAAQAIPGSRQAATHPPVHPAPAATSSARTASRLSATGKSPAAVGVLDADWGPQRAVFRVEAGCGRHGRRETFDLAHDPDSGRWQLERVTDR